MVAELAGPDGGPVCGGECDQVPFGDATLLPSTIHVVPEVAGVLVPAAALATTADGQTVVVLESGELQQVSVVASASGMAIVEGVDEGQLVRTPGRLG
jgi:hypothetical protein